MANPDDTWASEQWESVDLGDKRRTKRAVEMGKKMMAAPGESLGRQMGNPSDQEAAYRLLSSDDVSGQALTKPHRLATLRMAAENTGVTLLIQDRTTLDYTGHARRTTGLGKISAFRWQRGVLIQEALAVKAEDGRIFGLAHYELIVRGPKREPKLGHKRSKSAEARAWEGTVKAIGQVPAGARWVYVSDRESDIFEYMEACSANGAGFVVRVFQERPLDEPSDDSASAETRYLLETMRSLPPTQAPDAHYDVEVPETTRSAKRIAHLTLRWMEVDLKAPGYLKKRPSLRVWVVRAWEPSAPTGVKPLEWILHTSQPVANVAQARQVLDWYARRWLIEDFNMCLKTGCAIERSQLDSVNDIDRLLGFKLPIAARLLQLRQDVRRSPTAPAEQYVEPLYLRILRAKLRLKTPELTILDFWLKVAQLGGHRGRLSAGMPGWRSLWHGWLKLQMLVDGARLILLDTGDV